MNKKKILISDYDGTLCEVNSQINKETLDLFHSLAIWEFQSNSHGRSLFQPEKYGQSFLLTI